MSIAIPAACGLGAVVCLFAVACGSDHRSSVDRQPNVEVPLMVDVPAGEVISGFVEGRLRKAFEVEAFRITKHPVTNAEFASCVDEGACQDPDPDACTEQARQALARFALDQDDSPALCVGVKNARAFCESIGARLPTLSEWFRAARGPEPQRYAWGSQVPGCDQHARLDAIAPPGEHDLGKPVRVASCAALHDEGALRTARRKMGASPTGVEDVLLSPAELVGASSQPHFSACDARFSACIVVEREVGEIASVAPIREQTAERAYALRCVEEAE